MSRAHERPRTVTVGNGTLVWRFGGGGTAEIVDIDVSSERRREGIGRMMVGYLLDDLRKWNGANAGDGVRLIYAITRRRNLIAQSFYDSLGFRLLGAMHRFYSDPNDDALMFGKEVG